MGKWRGSPSSTYYIATFTSGGDRFSTVAGWNHRGNERIANEGGQKQEDF